MCPACAIMSKCQMMYGGGKSRCGGCMRAFCGKKSGAAGTSTPAACPSLSLLLESLLATSHTRQYQNPAEASSSVGSTGMCTLLCG